MLPFVQPRLTVILVLDTALERVPAELRAETLDMLTNTKSSASQKRNSLVVKGVSRNVCDELKVLAETCMQSVFRATSDRQLIIELQTTRLMRL